MWTAGQVAGRLGIAPATLRSWHHRYGIGPRAARPGQYRRYGDDDVARLERMRDLVASGVLPVEAARMVAAGAEFSDAAEVLSAVVSAAAALDTERCAEVLRLSVVGWGVIDAWTRVFLPALATADDGESGAPDCVACEHVLSWAAIRALHEVPRPEGRAASVVLACAEAESHTLGLEALAAALAERGVPVRMLGPQVPAEALAHAVRVSGARDAVLWSQRADTARAADVRLVAKCGARVLLAGPGWRRDLVAGHRVGSLATAVDALAL